MSIVSSDLARAIVANDASGVIRAVRASDPPCTHVAPGVPAIVYAACLQRPAALDVLISECPKNLAVDACYQRAPFAGWRAFHFAATDRDSELAAKLAAAGADTAPPPNELLGTAWLDLIEGLGNNEFVGYISACKASEDHVAFLNWTDPAGRAALHVAAVIGSGPLVHLLFELGLTNASPTDIAGNTPLGLAIQHVLPSLSCVQALLDHGATPTAEHVVSAASRGLARLVALLVGSGAPTPPGVSRRTLKIAIGAAAKLRSSSTVSMLGSDVLVNEAIARDKPEVLQILLATDAHDAASLLARVAACGSVRVLATLLAAPGGDPNARLRAPECAFDGATALHCVAASYESREDHVALLVSAGADVNATLPCGLTAMDVANHARTRALLASHGGRYAPYETTAARGAFKTTLRLLVALQNVDFADMRNAIVAGADPNTTDMLGNSSLHQAVMQKSASDIVWLLKSGANIDAKAWTGDTPLHTAVVTRHLPTVELLLAAGADPSIENAYGACPARLAARLSDVAAWRAITTHVAARCGRAERREVSTAARGGEPHPPRKGRATRPKPPPAVPPVSGEELRRREAAAEAAAAELIAGEAAEKAQRARKELQRTKRRLKKQQARLLELEEEDGESRESVDDDLVDEPDWIADLLEDFDAGSDPAARRHFVEHSVRMCASLKLQLEAVQRCVVCLDGARGTVLQPCGHASLCRMCAGRVADAPPATRRCPVCMQAVTGWVHAFV
jgi:ankyrin repeat protein